MADHCGESLSLTGPDAGAETRYLCIVPAAEPHTWHRDRFDPTFLWQTKATQQKARLVEGEPT